MCYNETIKYKEVKSWLIRFLTIAFPAALALMSALYPLSLKVTASTLSTVTLASSAVPAQMFAL